MSNRTWNKALKEIEETQILVDYLLHYYGDLDDLDDNYFDDKTVKEAQIWAKNQGAA